MPRKPRLQALRTNHDHDRCIEDALAAAVTRCRASGARLTPLRRRVLEILWQSHKPLGAYAILDVLAGEGRRAMPPTVYRALDFLQAQGLVHRIPSLNAYLGCGDPGAHRGAQYLICRACGTVAELADSGVESRLSASARAQGFRVEHILSEAVGLCPGCAARGSAA